MKRTLGFLLLSGCLTILFGAFALAKPALAKWEPAEDPTACGGGCQANTYCVHNTETSEYRCQAYVPGGTDPDLASQYHYGSWQIPSRDQFVQEVFSDEAISAADWYQYATTAFTHSVGILMIQPAPDSSGGNAGVIGAFGSLIAGMTSQPPVKTATYIADLGQSLGFVTPAYAQGQGTGFKALEPVLPIWKAFRNLAYFGFVIIFVVIGFMIMFRAQINPQTVVSVQAALPKIVVTLLLITFSYAIAAFMVDLIYLLIYLLIATFQAFGIVSDPEAARRILLDQSIFITAFNDLVGLGKEQAAWTAADAVASTINGLLGAVGGSIAGLISAPLAYVIFAVAIVIAIFKLFLQLLLAYIGIIFSTIFAPITLLFNALPGNNGFLNWLKGIAANALVFPVTAVMFLVAGALLNSARFGIEPGIGYDITNRDFAATQLPFVGGGARTGAISGLIGIGFLMMMPKVIELVQKMMGIEGGFAGMVEGPIKENLMAPKRVYERFGQYQTEADQMAIARAQLGSQKPRLFSKVAEWWGIPRLLKP